jgi:hypothetical protein
MRFFPIVLALVCAVAPQALAVDGTSFILVEDFDSAKPQQFPARWRARDAQTAERVYKVVSENGEQFLHAVAKAQSAQIALAVRASCEQYPVLTWRWRIAELPKGGDERDATTNDSAAGVYVVFKGSFGGLIPRALKYVWSAREPRGAAFPSPGYSTAQIVVLESGTDGAGQWRTEKVNVAADYRRLFNAEPPEVQGIAVLTDADDTGTEATADYDDFRLLAVTAAASAEPPLTNVARAAAVSR